MRQGVNLTAGKRTAGEHACPADARVTVHRVLACSPDCPPAPAAAQSRDGPAQACAVQAATAAVTGGGHAPPDPALTAAAPTPEQQPRAAATSSSHEQQPRAAATSSSHVQRSAACGARSVGVVHLSVCVKKRRGCSMAKRATYACHTSARSGGRGPVHQNQRGWGVVVGRGRWSTAKRINQADQPSGSTKRINQADQHPTSAWPGATGATRRLPLRNRMHPTPRRQLDAPILRVVSTPRVRRLGPRRAVGTGELGAVSSRPAGLGLRRRIGIGAAPGPQTHQPADRLVSQGEAQLHGIVARVETEDRHAGERTSLLEPGAARLGRDQMGVLARDDASHAQGRGPTRAAQRELRASPAEFQPATIGCPCECRYG